MNRDDVIRMAREVGFGNIYWSENDDRFVRFAALVAAAEREACAQVAEKHEFARSASAAIRARGNNE